MTTRINISIPEASAGGIFEGRFPQGNAPVAPSFLSNVMAINFAATGGEATTYAEGMRHWKNALRESSGFFDVSLEFGAPANVTLNAQGWPTSNFTVRFWNTSNGATPSWATTNGGVFNCGFSGSGAETVTAQGQCTISDLVQSTSTGLTTFKMTCTGAGGGFGIGVGNVTQAVTDQFYYLPEYNTESGIDNPLDPSSITNEAKAHYSNYHHVRFMNWSGVLHNTTPMTAANRPTPANTQCGFYAQTNGGAASCTVANPAVFNGGSTFAVNGVTVQLFNEGTGTPPGGFSFNTPYFVVDANTSAGTFSLAATSGGTPIASTSAGSNFGIGNGQGEVVPQEWFAALCMACGTGIWLNIGPIFDETYLTSLANALFAMVPPGTPIYLEIGDELWNGGGPPWGQSFWSGQANAFSGGSEAFIVSQFHSIATVFRSVFGSRYGTDVRLIFAWQAGGNGVFFKSLVFADYISQGLTIPAIDGQGGDLWGTAIAPYMDLPGFGNAQFFGGTASLASDGVMTVTEINGSIFPGAVYTGTDFPANCEMVEQLSGVAGGIGTYQMSVTGTTAASTAISQTSFSLSASIEEIQAQLTLLAEIQPFYSLLEQNTVMGMKYGLPQLSYEGGWQTNGESNGLINGGAAILDTGMTAVMNAYAQAMVNAGALRMTIFQGGLDTNDALGGLTPVDNLGVTYPCLGSNSPRFQSILDSANVTPTRNAISSTGPTTIPGNAYLDTNWGPAPLLNDNGDGAPFDAPNFGTGGQVSYLCWSPVAQTIPLSVNWTNSGTEASETGLEWAGDGQPFQILGGVNTPTLVSIPVGTSQVSLGTINVPAGHFYVSLGSPNVRQTIQPNSLTFG